MAEPIPQSLLAALADLVSWLDKAQVPSMVIGGVAASVLGRPRLTQDVDALAIVPEPEWGSLMSAAAGHGIVPRIEDALAFAGRSRVLLMQFNRGVTATISIAPRKAHLILAEREAVP